MLKQEKLLALPGMRPPGGDFFYLLSIF